MIDSLSTGNDVAERTTVCDRAEGQVSQASELSVVPSFVEGDGRVLFTGVHLILTVAGNILT